MKILKVLGFIPVTIICAWYLFEDFWYRRYIPENIGLNYHISIKSSAGFREGCGTAVYRMNRETAEAIKEQGIKFFAGAGQDKGRPGGYHVYGKWMQTPRDDWHRAENWSYELLCGGSIGDSLYDEIVESGRTAGSYYSYKHEAVLMVMPEKRLVVFSHNG